MAAPTFVDFDVEVGSSRTSCVFTWADVVGEADNDCAIITIHRETQAALTPPAGWALLGTYVQDTGGFKYEENVYWHRRSGAETTATWSWTGAAWAFLNAMVFRGCPTSATPFVNLSFDKETAQNTQPAHPGITIGAAASALGLFICNFAASTNTGTPTGMTAEGLGASSEVWGFYDLTTTTGATGTITGSLGDPEYASSIAFEVLSALAITYKSEGSGASTETSGAALSPACPATVDVGDILIAHVYWEGTVSTPNTPSGWTLLDGPRLIETNIASMWVFGKIADGTEDGAAIAFGNPAVTTQRAARVYSFAGRVEGSITDCVDAASFAFLSHATDPAFPTVTTNQSGALAVALIGQNDNNAFASATGETGGDWAEISAGHEYTVALTPGLSIGIQTATPTSDPGTITGGTMATTNDPCGVIGFAIKHSYDGAGLIAPDAVRPAAYEYRRRVMAY